MKTESDLLKLKSDIDKAKVAVSELTGQRNALMKQLEEFGCKTIDDADSKLKEIESEVSVFNNKITTGIKELEEKYQ